MKGRRIDGRGAKKHNSTATPIASRPTAPSERGGMPVLPSVVCSSGNDPVDIATSMIDLGLRPTS
jgi:hypothetical protein